MKVKKVDQLIKLPLFSNDAFYTKGLVHLCPIADHIEFIPSFVKLEREVPMVQCPRVGLTLLKFDPQKEAYWMAEYRFCSKPSLLKQGYALNLLVFSMMLNNVAPENIAQHVTVKLKTILTYESMLKLAEKFPSISKYHRKSLSELSVKDYAEAYSLCKKLFL